jgi:hypothetical protein
MLNISYLSDGKGNRPSFAIHYNEINLFEEAFLKLKQKTGVYVDHFGKTRIYPDHQKILINSLLKRDERRIIEFIKFLETSCKDGEVLIADGD